MTSAAPPADGAVVRRLLQLIEAPGIQSISCPWDDELIWRALVEKQLLRAAAMGVAPHVALALGGPDHLLPFDVFDWGGELHQPWEGALDADLFVNPSWRGVRYGLAYEGGGIFGATGWKARKYLVVRGTHPSIEGAEHEHIDGWTLYRATSLPTQELLDRDPPAWPHVVPVRANGEDWDW